MSKQPEMQEFWKNSIYNGFWIEAGFDLDPKPSHGTLWNRFAELEKPEIVAKVAEIADRLIRNAIDARRRTSAASVHIDASRLPQPRDPATTPAPTRTTCSYAEGIQDAPGCDGAGREGRRAGTRPRKRRQRRSPTTRTRRR